MYMITSTEEHNEKANDFETKSMFFMLNYYTNSNDIEWFVIDFFNDITGVNNLCNKCFDLQSKGVKNISPKFLGRYLVTLYKNYVSDLNFVDFIIFLDSVNDSIAEQIGNKTIFHISDLNQETNKIIFEGLKDEAQKKSYIDKALIDDAKFQAFLKEVVFVINSHSNEECIKDAVKLSSCVAVDGKALRNIFKHIRDAQASKKNNKVEGITIYNINDFLKYDKYINKKTIYDYIINTICFKSALSEMKHTPHEFEKLLRSYDESIDEEIIINCQNDLFRLLNDKNNIIAYWNLFAEITKLIKNNSKSSIEDIYSNLNKDLVIDVHHLNEISCKYYISLIKEAIE